MEHIQVIQYVFVVNIFSRHLTPVFALNKCLKKGGNTEQKMFLGTAIMLQLHTQNIELHPVTPKYHRYILVFTKISIVKLNIFST